MDDGRENEEESKDDAWLWPVSTIINTGTKTWPVSTIMKDRVVVTLHAIIEGAKKAKRNVSRVPAECDIHRFMKVRTSTACTVARMLLESLWDFKKNARCAMPTCAHQSFFVHGCVISRFSNLTLPLSYGASYLCAFNTSHWSRFPNVQYVHLE